jgi:acyl carrier protein
MSATHTAKALLADATGTELAAVPDAASVASFDRWDSLAHMRLLLGIEERIGRELDPDELARIETLSDVAQLLDAHPARELQ